MKPNSIPPKQTPDPKKATAMQTGLPRRFPRKVILFKGVTIKLYSLAWLAQLSGKSQRTIHKWERLQVFPRPIFQLEDGYRWYSPAEIHGYRRLIKAAGLRSGRYADGAKRTDWLKRNAFEFKAKLQQAMKTRIGDIPTELAQEKTIMDAYKKGGRVVFTEQEILRMIQD